MIKKYLTLLTSVAGVVTNASADLIAYEGFDYPTGGVLVDAVDSGFGWGSNWSRDTEGNDLDIIAAAANPTSGLTVTGNRVAKSGTGPDTGTFYSRSLSSAQNFSNGDVLWFSFNMEGSADAGTPFDFAFTSGGNEVLVIGNDPTKTSPDRNQFSVVEDGGTRNQQAAVSISGSFNFPQLVIGKITFGAGEDSLDLWYESSLAGDASEADLDTVVFSGLTIDDISSIDGISLQLGNSVQGRFDEIRLGTTYGDVVSAIPEPSAYGLISGFIALGWIMLSRRS